MSLESPEHRQIKEIINEKFVDWFGTGLTEYSDEGHRVDAYTVTLFNTSARAYIGYSR